MTGRQQEEIERLFRQYGEGVASFVLARVGSAELAEEITSRVFLTVVRQFGQQNRSPAGWLWAIVRTELARHFRECREVHAGVELLADAAGPPEQLVRRETHARLQAALERLSEDEQQIVYMKFFQDMRNQEIAAATGLTASHVGVIVFRTLKQLRALMEREETVRAAQSHRGDER